MGTNLVRYLHRANNSSPRVRAAKTTGFQVTCAGKTKGRIGTVNKETLPFAHGTGRSGTHSAE